MGDVTKICNRNRNAIGKTAIILEAEAVTKSQLNKSELLQQ